MTAALAPDPLSRPLPWDLVAPAYSAQARPHMERYAAEALRLAWVRPGQRVLDVACGPGTLAVMAAAAGAKVDALDFSPAMLAQLRRRVRDEGVERITLSCADGQTLPWPDDEFDAGFSMFGLMFFPDRLRGLRELRRVVRPGGAVVVSSWHPLEGVPELAALTAAVADAMPGPAPARAEAPLSSEPAIAAEMEAAGLRDLEVHSVSFAIDAPDAAAFWDGMERSMAPLALLRHGLGDAWEERRAVIRSGFISRVGRGPVRVAMPAFLALARA